MSYVFFLFFLYFVFLFFFPTEPNIKEESNIDRIVLWTLAVKKETKKNWSECVYAMNKVSKQHPKWSMQNSKRRAGAFVPTPTTTTPTIMNYSPAMTYPLIGHPSNRFIATPAFSSLVAPVSLAKFYSKNCWERATHCNAFTCCCDQNVDSAAKRDTTNSFRIR